MAGAELIMFLVFDVGLYVGEFAFDCGETLAYLQDCRYVVVNDT